MVRLMLMEREKNNTAELLLIIPNSEFFKVL